MIFARAGQTQAAERTAGAHWRLRLPTLVSTRPGVLTGLYIYHSNRLVESIPMVLLMPLSDL